MKLKYWHITIYCDSQNLGHYQHQILRTEEQGEFSLTIDRKAKMARVHEGAVWQFPAEPNVIFPFHSQIILLIVDPNKLKG